MAEEATPPEFACPITKDTMTDPVFTEDGQTYEREAIEAWFATGRLTSPATGLPLGRTTLAPNIALKNAIEAFQQERPQMERQVKNLRACLAECEHRLREANARAAAAVPHAEYELLMKRYGRTSESASDATTAPTSPDSSRSRSSADDDLVAAHKLALRRQAEEAEQASAQAALEKEQLAEEIRVCEGSAKASELTATREVLSAAVQREQMVALGEALAKREGERDAVGEQVLSCAESLGLDGPVLLTAIRARSTSMWRGSLCSSYAELHCECMALASERNVALETAQAAEKAGDELRIMAEAMKAKVQCLRARLQKLDAPIQAAGAQAKAARDALEQIEKDDFEAAMKATAAWSERASLQPSAENVQKLAAVRKKCEASLQGFRREKVLQLKDEGRTASDLKHVGFTAGELGGAACTASELKEAGFTAWQLKQGGFAASQAQDAGFDVRQLREGCYTAGELREAGCAVEALAEAGFTAEQLRGVDFSASQLRTVGFEVDTLREGGFSAGQVQDAGFTHEDMRKAGFAVSEMVELGLALGELVGCGFPAGQLREAGFTASDLKGEGCTAPDLKQAGFTASDLKQAGFTIAELEESGFTQRQLKEAGTTAHEFKCAGFTAQQLKEVGFTALECYNAGYAANDLFSLCACLPDTLVGKQGMLIVTRSGYGRLESRSNNDHGPWYAGDLWPRGTADAKGTNAVQEIARAVEWE